MTDKPAFFAGAASGFTVRLLTQPLDVLKILFQLQVEPISKKRDSYYRGISHAVKRIYREEGITGFWKGHIPAQYLSIVFGSVQFYTFESLYKLTKKSHSSYNDLIYGGISGAAASLFCHPIDVIRTRLVGQGQFKKYRGSPNAILSILREENVGGFFRGLVPSLLLIIPQTSVQFSVYHGLTRAFENNFPKQNDGDQVVTFQNSGFMKLLNGSIAGMVSKFIIYPLDLTKRRLQVQGFEEVRQHFGELHLSQRMVDSIKVIIKKEGIFGLYKGLFPSSIKAGIVSSLTFYFFESFKSFFEKIYN